MKDAKTECLSIKKFLVFYTLASQDYERNEIFVSLNNSHAEDSW